MPNFSPLLVEMHPGGEKATSGTVYPTGLPSGLSSQERLLFKQFPLEIKS